TAPGTVTPAQPCGAIGLPAGYADASVPAADRPEALSALSWPSDQTNAKASEPRPLLVGSTTVRVAAVAIAASTALPPRRRISSPACAANGWLVATQRDAKTGMR